MKFRVNYDGIRYAINNNEHVEFFVWNYLRMCGSTGLFPISAFNPRVFCLSSIEEKAKDNTFYLFKKNKFILKSPKNIKSFYFGKYDFECEFSELCKYANKLAQYSGNKIKKWNSTLIKYFLIAVYSCRYRYKKPYALCLISEDLGVSIKTIQRALKVFDVARDYVKQTEPSLRSYTFQGERVNLTPNFYAMRFGKTRKFHVY